MYRKYIKRLLDILCALAALIVFSWLYIILIVLGAIFMRGNPFFFQERPGRNGKIFKLVKFRTMDNRTDKNGELLPDVVRLNKYGRLLRKTSLDELPEAFNILIGNMSVVGPRPLALQYFPYYSEREMHRHDVRPGLTGLAQVCGRNATTWEERFNHDLEYIDNMSFINDVKIVCKTVLNVVKCTDIGVRGVDSLMDFDVYRKNQISSEVNADEYNR